jgi:GNAT superfamily N-acetyltransferase
MSTLHYRKAKPEDMDWAYQLFRTTMKEYIDQTWGWDELFQRHGFDENIRSAGLLIVSLDDKLAKDQAAKIGAYSLKQNTGYLLLDMLLVAPQWQRHGYGSRILQHILQQGNATSQPIRLSVLRNNPAYHFYCRHGFTIESQDDFRYRMISEQRQ